MCFKDTARMCTACNHVKGSESFYAGPRNVCKACASTQRRQRYLRQRETIIAAQRERYATDPAYRERAKRYSAEQYQRRKAAVQE